MECLVISRDHGQQYLEITIVAPFIFYLLTREDENKQLVKKARKKKKYGKIYLSACHFRHHKQGSVGWERVM